MRLSLVMHSFNERLLYLAASEGRLTDVVDLVNSGVCVSASDVNGRQALGIAAWFGQLDVVRYLLAQDASPNHRDHDNRTALMYACSSGKTHVARLLLEAQADASIRESHAHWSAMHIAASHGFDDIVSLLLEHRCSIARSEGDPCDHTPLHVASTNGHASTVALLLERNAAIDAVDKLGRSPLMLGARTGSVAVVEELLKRHADVNHQDSAGDTALMVASIDGRSAVLSTLIAHGACKSHTNVPTTSIPHQSRCTLALMIVCDSLSFVNVEDGKERHGRGQELNHLIVTRYSEYVSTRPSGTAILATASLMPVFLSMLQTIAGPFGFIDLHQASSRTLSLCWHFCG